MSGALLRRIEAWKEHLAMTDDPEKQVDDIPTEAPVEEPSDGEAGSADTESGVEPESEPGA